MLGKKKIYLQNWCTRLKMIFLLLLYKRSSSIMEELWISASTIQVTNHFKIKIWNLVLFFFTKNHRKTIKLRKPVLILVTIETTWNGISSYYVLYAVIIYSIGFVLPCTKIRTGLLGFVPPCTWKNPSKKERTGEVSHLEKHFILKKRKFHLPNPIKKGSEKKGCQSTPLAPKVKGRRKELQGVKHASPSMADPSNESQ